MQWVYLIKEGLSSCQTLFYDVRLVKEQERVGEGSDLEPFVTDHFWERDPNCAPKFS